MKINVYKIENNVVLNAMIQTKINMSSNKQV